jgi:(1->4)-alpha-D-glucan 1-alpha-D-glucosylmutase
LFTVLESLLTLQPDGTIDDDRTELALRFQQLTGPATAKGEEDTASYRYVRLLALNDVGMAPDRFSVDTEELLTWCESTANRWPRTMLNTSTHDSKRSEDVRARLAVLSEVPERWGSLVAHWHESNTGYRGEAIDPLTEWFVYQTVFAVHPRPAEQIWPAIEKSLRESKLRTSWVHPEAQFEAAVQGFLEALLTDPAFLEPLEQFLDDIMPAARANALAQLTLRLTVPGVPDTYQGTELWTSALVDPDNRHPVDYEARSSILRRWAQQTPAERWLDDPCDGSAKLLLLRTLLHMRSTTTTFESLPVKGPVPCAAVAFRRGDLTVVVPRWWLAGDEAHAQIVVTLPPGHWRDECTGQIFNGGDTTVSALCSQFPVWVGTPV